MRWLALAALWLLSITGAAAPVSFAWDADPGYPTGITYELQANECVLSGVVATTATCDLVGAPGDPLHAQVRARSPDPEQWTDSEWAAIDTVIPADGSVVPLPFLDLRASKTLVGGGIVAAPTYQGTTESNNPVTWGTANTSATRTTPSYSPAAGTILVGAAVLEDTTLSQISSISGGPAWTQQYLTNPANKTGVALYTATAEGGSITSTVTRNASTSHKCGLAVLQFTDSDGIGAKNTASGTSGTPSVSLTTTQDNSAIVAVIGDWAAVTGTSTFSDISGSSAVEVVDYADGTAYGVHIAYWPNVGAAGSKTVAMSAPSGQNWIIQAIEVKGISSVTPVPEPNDVAYVGISSSVEVNGTDITLTEPSGVQEGDLLVAFMSHRSTIGFQLPSGWTQKVLDESSGNTSTTTTSSIASGEMFYTIRGGSAPTLTFTKESGTGNVGLGRIVAFRNVDRVSPIRSAISTTLAANSATVVTTGNISPLKHDAVLAVFAGADNVTWSAEQINGTPTSLSEVADAGTNTGADTSLAVGYAIMGSDISTQTVQATASASSRHVVMVLDIKPAPSVFAPSLYGQRNMTALRVRR